MKLRHRVYLRLNLMSLFFIAVSFISVTLAWFAYSGLTRVSTNIDVKAWYIKLSKDSQEVSNNMVISLSDIYPGMNTVNEKVNIENLGDSDAEVKYSIVSARILGDPKDDYIVDVDGNNSLYVEDQLSHGYPFHINISLSKGYVVSGGKDNASFEVSISWPLDSDKDDLDSLWGATAYNFEQSEKALRDQDPNYQVRPSIEVIISLTAQQYTQTPTESDTNYNLGDVMLYDVVSNHTCSAISSTCIKTYVIDTNNELGDTTVTLLPDPINSNTDDTYNNYSVALSTVTNGWKVTTRPLLVSDMLKIISTDILNSFLIRDGLSNSIIGNLRYNNRMNTEIALATAYNGYYNFSNERFGAFATVGCYWTSSEYNANNAFAIRKVDGNNSRIYGENKTTTCSVIPVIVVNKMSL